MSLLLWVWLPTLLVLWYTRLFVRRSANRASTERTSFIVIRLDALGDLVLTTPVFRELKRSFPHGHLTVVAQAAYRSILITNPHIDELLLVEPSGSKLLPKAARNLLGVWRLYWRELRGRQFDVAISPRWDTDEHHAALLSLLTNAVKRVGYSERVSPGKRRYNGGFDRAFDFCLEPGPLQHEVMRNLAIVDAVGGTIGDRSLDIHLTNEDRGAARSILRAASPEILRIALGIGAQSPGRRWPLQRYGACICELAKDFPVQTVITCAPAEHSQAVLLASMIPGERVISDSADIRETCALLAECDLFIGNDTGAAHLAAAMGCATIVISRHPKSGNPAHPNCPTRFMPFCAWSRVLQPEHGLPGRSQRCTQVEPHCIEQVSVAEVVAAVQERLAAKAGAGAELELALR